jgi:serine/threonine-protein kinase HipA
MEARSMQLTLQTRLDAGWQDAASLTIADPAKGRSGAAALRYEPQQYVLDHLGASGLSACSLLYPVAIAETYRNPNWFSFLDDIMPAGSARRYWVNTLGIGSLSGPAQDALLLHKGTIAPIGNLRIKESLPELPAASQLRYYRFSIQDVVERQSDFLEYAQEMGAASGGATGAGGEAPKLLLRCSASNQIWIDTWQDEKNNTDQHYLVKFPRNQRTEIDCDILRAEYHYYRELNALNVDTVDMTRLRLIEGEQYPSLWLPRFDVAYVAGQEQRFGLESIYSLMQQGPGSALNHFDVIRKLVGILRGTQTDFNAEQFVIEWVRRDLLNIVFGNSDNHGRNSAVLKSAQQTYLSPVYDFAPMKADPEGIIRSTKWGLPFEEGGNFNWIAIASELNDLVPAEKLIVSLRQLASGIIGLGDRLRQRGVSERIMRMPTFGFDDLSERLKRWQLLQEFSNE